MLGKLFGKKPKFFLELKEDERKEPAPETPVAEAVVAEAAPLAQASAQPEPTPPPAQPEPKAKKSFMKKNKAKAEKVTPAKTEVVPAVAATHTATEVEFATNYLIVPTMSRRKPGPSLNAYKEMARKAKLPSK